MEAKELYRLIDSRRKDLGLTQAEVTKRAFGRDADTSAIQNLRRGSIPSYATLEAICKALDLEVKIAPLYDGTFKYDGSITYRGEPVAPPQTPQSIQLGTEEFALIPLYDLDASAGDGLVPAAEEIADRLAFSRAWLLQSGISAEKAALVRVRGDSMEPTLPHDALALIQLLEAGVEGPGVYAFSREGEVFIKRLVPTDRCGLVVVSDNAAYPPEVLPPHDASRINLIGRIRAYTREVQ